MSKIYVDEILPKDNAKITAADLQLPAGSVIQVVENNTIGRGNVDYNSTSWVNDVSVSITPKYSNSKILITATTSIVNSNGSNPAGGYNGINRDGVNLICNEVYHSDSAQYYKNLSIQHLDSPNTTNQLTYSLAFWVYTGQLRTFGNDSTVPNVRASSIIVQEIAQ